MARMLGERLRKIRQVQERSLADVAGKAKISIATLSRIENGKQTLDVEMLVTLAKVLGVPPTELVDNPGAAKGDGADTIVRTLAGLESRDRARVWRNYAVVRKSGKGGTRRVKLANIGDEVDELLAQIELLRQELQSVQKRLKKR
jgi:transcriptional regulator with XRE-family HTH domain